jgi:hypothetical protein
MTTVALPGSTLMRRAVRWRREELDRLLNRLEKK